jgi:hypothetical protein
MREITTMEKGRNANHPKKGDRVTVDPIRSIKDIRAISALTSKNPRDHLLFVMGINNGLRAGDLIEAESQGRRDMKVGDTLLINQGKQDWKEQILGDQ